MISLKFTMTLLKANIGLLKRPYKLNLYLTDRCNARCKTCNIWQKKPEAELDTKELARFFKINNYFYWIDITGGEIFLRNDIEDIFRIVIKECKNLYLLHFPTNGFLTNRIYDSVNFIKKYFRGRLVITVSVDGNPVLHDSVRGIQGGWDRAVETFRKIESINNGDTYFGYTISRFNLGEIQNTYNSLKEKIPDLDFSRLHVNLAQSSEIYYSNFNSTLHDKEQDVKREIDCILSNRKYSPTPFNLLETCFLKRLKRFVDTNKYPFKRCMALNSTITINPKGDVYPCLFFNKRLGSLREADFNLDKIIASGESVRLKKNILDYCRPCWTVCEAYPSVLSNLIPSLNHKIKSCAPEYH